MSAETDCFRPGREALLMEGAAGPLVRACFGESAWALSTKLRQGAKALEPGFHSLSSGITFAPGAKDEANAYTPGRLRRILEWAGHVATQPERDFVIRFNTPGEPASMCVEMRVMGVKEESDIFACGPTALPPALDAVRACAERAAALIKIKAVLYAAVPKPPKLKRGARIQLNRFFLRIIKSSLSREIRWEGSMSGAASFEVHENTEKEAAEEEKFAVEISIGQIELRLEEFLSLRPGARISIPFDPKHRAALAVAGVHQGAGRIEFSPNRAEFILEEIFWGNDATKFGG